MSIRLYVTGTQFTINALTGLDGRLRFKTVRIALNAYGGVVKRAAMAGAPKGSGLLGKSIRVKVKVPDASYNKAHHGKPAYVVIGPGRGIFGFKTKTGRVGAKTLAAGMKQIDKRGGSFQTVKERSRFLGGRLGIYKRRASRYAHFAEKGRKGTGGSHFLEKAATSTMPTAMAALQNKMASGITELCGQIFASQVAEQSIVSLA